MTHLLHWPNKYLSGISHFDENRPHLNKKGESFEPLAGDWLPFSETLKKEHDDDAHCVFYAVEDEGELVPVPVLRKASYHAAPEAGVRIVSTGFGFDFDTPGHVELTEELMFSMLGQLETAWESNETLGRWSAWYTTRNGMRVMYTLDKPIDAAEGERYWIALHHMYKEAGVKMDSLTDWTRRFRLPRVVRDHMHTSSETLHTLVVEEKPLSLDGIEPANLKSMARTIAFTPSDDHPDHEECRKRLEISGDKGRPKRTKFHQRARKVLKTSPYYDVLFDECPLPDEDRHGWLMQAFGSVVPVLLKRAGASSEDIFALFDVPILQWEHDTCEEDPHEHAWSCLNHVYSIEVQQYNEHLQDEAEKVQDSEETARRMIEGMRIWDDSPEIAEGKPFETQMEYLLGRLFANADRFFYPLNENGRYENSPVMKEQIIPLLRHCHLSALITGVQKDEEGKIVAATDIISQHSFPVQRVKAKPQQGAGGYLQGLDGWNPELVLPMYRRNPRITAQCNPLVDGWLRALFGKHYDNVAMWIGYALDFEAGAMCALSIAGNPGAGKKMFYEGLGECLERPRVASGDALAANFNDELMDTPFLTVNERWPQTVGAGSSPSDSFKLMTGGDTLTVQPKFKSKISLVNPMRVIMMANNMELVKSLVRGREQTSHDREALGERIMHVDIDGKAREYLWSIGGMGTTAKEGARWIRGDGGQASDFVVARHFLWLYENRPKVDTRQRFCVMGNCSEDSAEMFQMVTQSNDMPKVMRAVITLINNRKSNPGLCRVHEGMPACSLDNILKVIRDTQDDRISESALESCVEALSGDGHPVEVDSVYMWRLNLDMIMQYAKKWGIKCDALETEDERTEV